MFVTPAQAAVQLICGNKSGIPAFAGMTKYWWWPRYTSARNASTSALVGAAAEAPFFVVDNAPQAEA